MMPQLNRFFSKARVLFIRDNCPICRNWKKIVERFNMEVPISKRIRIVDCTKHYNFGIVEDPLLNVFYEYIKGYPTLFFEGAMINGANSVAEAEAYIKSALHNDFIVERENRFLFKKECKFIKEGRFKKKRIFCYDED